MKKKIVFAYMAYPFAIASYFRHVLEKMPDVDLFTVGPYTGDFIPWNGGMKIPLKYVKPVDLALPATQGFMRPAWSVIKDRLPWKPDLVICCDAGFHFSTRPDAPYAVIGTDPHVLNADYDQARSTSDWFWNMQRYYMKVGDLHLPYCCSPDHHFAMSNVEKDYDASLIGLHYKQRDDLVNALRNNGKKVLYSIGLIYDEYREQNNRAKIGLNWSSLMDINARTFEIMAMRQIPVINRLPHLDELGLHENEHYLGFDTIGEAVEKVKWALSNPDSANEIANCAYQHVHANHTYELRMKKILEVAGL